MEAMMKDESRVPAVVERAAFEAELAALRAREKAHTHEGDAIAAARRRPPIVEVEASTPVIGPDVPLALLNAFEEGRQRLEAGRSDDLGGE
jgi:predicted dithiol-disulfide oxidoreductase (DUF899 family)